jgi:hypothetical protein
MKKVAVLGAGVMGAQIAAHLVNVKVPVMLFDLPAKEGPKSGIAERAIANLKKLKPSPIGVADDVELIQPANYEEHMKLLKGCDLVIEAIAERMDWKLDLYTRSRPSSPSTRCWRPTPRACRSPSCPRPARRHQAALLRHPLLQPAALHAAGGADQHAHHAGRGAGPARSLCHQHAGQGRGARTTRPTSSPTASASPACCPR